MASTVLNGGAVQTPGESYTLTCSVSGADDLDSSYQWKKNCVNVDKETTSTLFFSHLRLSDTGSYVCEVTVSSATLDGGTVTVSSNPVNVSLPGELVFHVLN